MSGHSHFSTIKHKKEATDKKRGQTFSKLARAISVAVKEKGVSPETNYKLKIVIETARSFNMPRESIDRAIQKGIGETSGENLEEVSFEAFGPFGIALVIEGITDNKNRILGEIKQILSQHNGKLAGEGSVKWLFDKKGVIIINFSNLSPPVKTREELELFAIESGADDFYWHDNFLDVYTKPDGLEMVKKKIEEKNIQIESASLDWVAKETIILSEEQKTELQKLFDSLDENDAVQNVYSNLGL